MTLPIVVTFHLQQPVKKSKKAKVLKAKTPAVKAEVSPDENMDTHPANTATVLPTHPVMAVQSHRPEPHVTDPGYPAEASADPQVTPPADMTVSTVTPLPLPTDPLLLHMMRMLEQANPMLSRDPRLLQMTAMNHMMALQHMQQQQQQQQPAVEPQLDPQQRQQPVIKPQLDPQQQLKQQQLQLLQQRQQQMQLQWARPQQRPVEINVSSQGGGVDGMSTTQPATQPDSVAPQESSELQSEPADQSPSRPPLHWPTQTRPTELGQEPARPSPIQQQQPAAPTQVKPSKQRQAAATEASQRPAKRHPSPAPSPAPGTDKQQVVSTAQDDTVKPAAKVPGFLGRQRKTTTKTATTNVFTTSRNYGSNDGSDNAASSDAGGENWDSEVDPYASTWTWGQGTIQAPEPVKEPPKPPIPGLLQKTAKKKNATTQDVNPVKVTQAPSIPPTQVPSTQAPTRPGNFFKKPPTPTLIPITQSSWNEAEPQLNLTDSSAFPGLPSHRQQKKAAGSSSVSELSNISLKPAATNSVSALCDIPISSTSASAVGFSAAADSVFGGKYISKCIVKC